MATSGVKWEFDRDHLILVLKKHKGRIVHTAEEMKISRRTLRKYLDQDEELNDLIAELRTDFEETLLDKSENVLEKALDQHDLSHALRSAFFVLDSKGESRGYKNTNVSTNTVCLVKQDPTKCDNDRVSTQVQVPELPDTSMECPTKGD